MSPGLAVSEEGLALRPPTAGSRITAQYRILFDLIPCVSPFPTSLPPAPAPSPPTLPSLLLPRPHSLPAGVVRTGWRPAAARPGAARPSHPAVRTVVPPAAAGCALHLGPARPAALQFADRPGLRGRPFAGAVQHFVCRTGRRCCGSWHVPGASLPHRNGFPGGCMGGWVGS